MPNSVNRAEQGQARVVVLGELPLLYGERREGVDDHVREPPTQRSLGERAAQATKMATPAAERKMAERRGKLQHAKEQTWSRRHQPATAPFSVSDIERPNLREHTQKSGKWKLATRGNRGLTRTSEGQIAALSACCKRSSALSNRPKEAKLRSPPLA